MAPSVELAADATERSREARRELAKLSAAFLNGVAVAIVAIGGLTPLVAYVLEPSGAPAGLVLVTVSPISIFLGGAFHLAARATLRAGFRT